MFMPISSYYLFAVMDHIEGSFIVYFIFFPYKDMPKMENAFGYDSRQTTFWTLPSASGGMLYF
jgi:hypothetical protein